MKNYFRLLSAIAILIALFTHRALLAAEDVSERVFEVQRICLKKMELKQPNSPAIFLATEQPKISVSLNTEPSKISNDTYEVRVNILLSAFIKNKLAYSINAEQVGIFTVKNVSADQIDAIKGIACPNIIYPYLRANVADLTTRAGFAVVHLSEVNWEIHYKQQKERKK